MPPSPMFERVMRALAAGDRPATGLRTIRTDTVVAADVQTTFAFFSNAANLERLTPPWIHFRILSPLPVAISERATIDYHIVLYGLPIPWRTRIGVWEAGRRFVDRQIAGPYRWWRHEHRFEPHHGGTRAIDEVEYAPRFAPLSAWLVARDVGRTFAFRQQVLAQLLASPRAVILEA